MGGSSGVLEQRTNSGDKKLRILKGELELRIRLGAVDGGRLKEGDLIVVPESIAGKARYELVDKIESEKNTNIVYTIASNDFGIYRNKYICRETLESGEYQEPCVSLYAKSPFMGKALEFEEKERAAAKLRKAGWRAWK